MRCESARKPTFNRTSRIQCRCFELQQPTLNSFLPKIAFENNWRVFFRQNNWDNKPGKGLKLDNPMGGIPDPGHPGALLRRNAVYILVYGQNKQYWPTYILSSRRDTFQFGSGMRTRLNAVPFTRDRQSFPFSAEFRFPFSVFRGIPFSIFCFPRKIPWNSAFWNYISNCRDNVSETTQA